MEFSQIISLSSLGVSFLSVLVAFFAVRESRKTVFSGAYFSEMVNAYTDYLKCVASFIYRRELSEIDAMTSALYKLMLYAPPFIGTEAKELYLFVLDWASSKQETATLLDEKIDHLRERMRENITDIQKNGHFL